MNKTKLEAKIKFSWGGTHPFFYHPFISSFTPDLKGKTVLDCGCGKGINGYHLRVTRDLIGAHLIGMDINTEFLSFCKRYRVYDKLVRHKIPLLPFRDKSIDFLLCTEVVEHLSKNEGVMLLQEIDRVCRGRSIITTPNVYFQTVKGEREDAHYSKWVAADFRQRDFRVYGMGFKTTLLPEDPLLKIKQALYYLFTPLSFLIPEISGALLCVKDY